MTAQRPEDHDVFGRLAFTFDDYEDVNDEDSDEDSNDDDDEDDEDDEDITDSGYTFNDLVRFTHLCTDQIIAYGPSVEAVSQYLKDFLAKFNDVPVNENEELTQIEFVLAWLFVVLKSYMFWADGNTRFCLVDFYGSDIAREIQQKTAENGRAYFELSKSLTLSTYSARATTNKCVRLHNRHDEDERPICCITEISTTRPVAISYDTLEIANVQIMDTIISPQIAIGRLFNYTMSRFLSENESFLPNIDPATLQELPR